MVSEVFGPIYRELKITSTYEYLEMRFSRMVRYLALIVFYIQNIAYIGIVIYGKLSKFSIYDHKLYFFHFSAIFGTRNGYWYR